MSLELKIRNDNYLVLRYNPLDRTLSIYNLNDKLFESDKFDSGLLNYPVRAVIDIAGSCNADCSYCSQKYKSIVPDIPTNIVYWLIDELEEMKVFELTLRGGEALTHPDFYRIWDYASEKSFLSTTVITNGMLLNLEKVAHMLQKPTSKIIISLDGSELINSRYRDPAQYALIMDWLPKFLPDHQNQFVILTTLYKENYDEMFNFAKFLASIGVMHHHITTLKRMGGSEFKKGSFVTFKEVFSLENFLEEVKNEFLNYKPMVAYRHSKSELGKFIEEVQMPFFTDYYSGTALKVTSGGDVGISTMVFFTSFFRRMVGDKLSSFLNPLGNIYDKNFSSLKETWTKNLESRLFQSKIIDKYYEYYIGWESIENLS